MKNIFKKCLLPSLIFTALLFAAFTSTSVFAEGPFEGRTGSACGNFLGLTSWDCNVNSIVDEDSLKSGILQIIANVASDLTIIASYLVLGYVIYGGYRYIFSEGDPNKVATGKKTLMHAFIGLAIVMLANVIVATIRIVLVKDSGDLSSCVSEGGCVNANDLVENLISWAIGIAGVVSAVFLVYGGVLYITSSGDSGKTQKAKNTILYSIIGLVIVALSIIITAFVSNIIRSANDDATSYINSTISNKSIIKEVHENEIY